MDFNPKSHILHGQKEVDKYLAMYDIPLPSKIEVKWCSPQTDVTVSCPPDGVYFHPEILALGVKLPMTPFVQDAQPASRFRPHSRHRGPDELFWASKPSVLPLPLVHMGLRNSTPPT